LLQDPQTHRITDFFSFYSLPSTVIGNQKYPVLEAAYLYYYACDVAFEPNAEKDGLLKDRLHALITDALIVANHAKFDVFNALTLMDNVSILRDLKVRVFLLYLSRAASELRCIVWNRGWFFEFLFV